MDVTNRTTGWRVALLLGACLAVAAPAAGQRPDPDARPRRMMMERGWLGISFRPDTVADGGVVVAGIAPESPAAAADIQQGDRVVRWNGQTDVRAAIRGSRLEPGDTVALRIARAGQRDRDLSLVAETRDIVTFGRDGDRDVIVLRPREILRRMRIDGDSLVANFDSIHSRLRVLLRDSLGPQLERLERELPRARIEILRGDSVFDTFRGGLGVALAGGRFAVAGAELANVTPTLGGYFGADSGVLVLRVAPETPAADAGLLEGDVIVRAGGQDIANVEELRTAVLGDRPRRGGPRAGAMEDLPLEIIRQGSRYSVTLPR